MEWTGYGYRNTDGLEDILLDVIYKATFHVNPFLINGKSRQGITASRNVGHFSGFRASRSTEGPAENSQKSSKMH